MIRFIESKMPLANSDEYDIHFIMERTIWQKCKEYFAEHREQDTIPIFSAQGQLICYAWQDTEANREVRMLRELQEKQDAIDFCDLYPDYSAVLIHGCNELAWNMREYLLQKGIAVNVDGRFWKELGVEEGQGEEPLFQCFEIWAEGVHQKSGDWKQERLRSSSVEFECVNKIYEANIKAGKIADADIDVKEFLDRLRKEKQIVIRGTGTMAQDAYDWLMVNGIDICAFQSGRAEEGRKRLFGKPILRKAEIERKFAEAVILECSAQNSAWGFGDVDAYDYEGYKRNKRYFLLRDYIEVPENNLTNILIGGGYKSNPCRRYSPLQSCIQMV